MANLVRVVRGASGERPARVRSEGGKDPTPRMQERSYNRVSYPP